jgi:hypothetical protein
MIIRLSTISAGQDEHQFKAIIHIDTQSYTFTFTVNTYRIGSDDVRVIHGEPEFYQVLHQHQAAITVITKLVGRVYGGESVDLPVEIPDPVAL